MIRSRCADHDVHRLSQSTSLTHPMPMISTSPPVLSLCHCYPLPLLLLSNTLALAMQIPSLAHDNLLMLSTTLTHNMHWPSLAIAKPQHWSERSSRTPKHRKDEGCDFVRTSVRDKRLARYTIAIAVCLPSLFTCPRHACGLTYPKPLTYQCYVDTIAYHSFAIALACPR